MLSGDEAAKALVELLHGQKVTVHGTSQFFALFELAESLQIGPCQDVCQHAVSEKSYKKLPILLQCTTSQWQPLRRRLRDWSRTQPPYLADATIRVRKQSQEDKPNDRRLPAILSCYQKHNMKCAREALDDAKTHE